MAKKPAAKPEPAVEAAEATVPTEGSEPQAAVQSKPDLSKPAIREAIAQGKALIAEGKSKADAARAIFAAIGNEPKDVIVAAFIDGATLTEKGSLTYWYNCRRKAAKAGKA